MERKMRRSKQALTREECEEVLERGTAGVLALSGGVDEPPYAVPMSYGYSDGVLTFHGARVGHKHDLIAADPRASFCVIDSDVIVPEEFTSRFRSVICFGTIEVVDDPDEQDADLMAMGEKYSPGLEDACRKEIEQLRGKTRVLRLHVERMTGKESMPLARQRERNANVVIEDPSA